MFRTAGVATVLIALAAGSARQSSPAPQVDYPGIYIQGITFAEFLESARARRDEWRAHYNDATVSPDLITRMRALSEKRRLLVVAEDYCSDSVNTIPYLARLVDGAPERLEMRLVNSQTGKPIMDAHLTPDGRAATPTIAILAEDNRLLAAWTERPSAVQSWYLEKQKTMMQKPLHDELLAWYAKDTGRTAVAEIADLLGR